MLLPMIANQGRESHGDILREIKKWVEQEKITPLLHEEVFDFQEVGKAHEVLESGGALTRSPYGPIGSALEIYDTT